jgi:hypothetical protein
LAAGLLPLLRILVVVVLLLLRRRHVGVCDDGLEATHVCL